MCVISPVKMTVWSKALGKIKLCGKTSTHFSLQKNITIEKSTIIIFRNNNWKSLILSDTSYNKSINKHCVAMFWVQSIKKFKIQISSVLKVVYKTSFTIIKHVIIIEKN